MWREKKMLFAQHSLNIFISRGEPCRSDAAATETASGIWGNRIDVKLIFSLLHQGTRLPLAQRRAQGPCSDQLISTSPYCSTRLPQSFWKLQSCDRMIEQNIWKTAIKKNVKKRKTGKIGTNIILLTKYDFFFVSHVCFCPFPHMFLQKLAKSKLSLRNWSCF